MCRLSSGIFMCFALLLFSQLSAAQFRISEEDECQFLRDAIDAGLNYIPVYPDQNDGVYVCQSPIIIDKNNVTIEGISDQKVKFKLAARRLTPLLIIGSAQPGDHMGVVSHLVRNVIVKNFEFDGNRMAQIPLESGDLTIQQGQLYETPQFLSRQRQKECWGGLGCDIPGDPRSVIRNNGVTIRGAENVRLQDIISKNNLSGGLVTEKHCRNLQVERFESFNNLYDGFAGYETSASYFADLHLHHNFASGVSIDLNFSHNTFERSNFSYNGDNGIFARESSENSFDDIHIQQVCNNGIFLAASGEDGSKPATGYKFSNMHIRAMQKALRINDSTCTESRLEQGEEPMVGLRGNISLARGVRLLLNAGWFSSEDALNDHVSEHYSEKELQALTETCRFESRMPLEDDPSKSI